MVISTNKPITSLSYSVFTNGIGFKIFEFNTSLSTNREISEIVPTIVTKILTIIVSQQFSATIKCLAIKYGCIIYISVGM